MAFNAEVIPEDSQEEVEALIKSTRRELRVMLYFITLQLAIDLAFSVDSVVNRNLAYIEMSRFYAEIGRWEGRRLT